MTLTEILQIKEQYLQYQDLRAMDYCEKRWQAEGKPATKWGMVNFLERMLQELKRNGIGYPKVLLLRKKEIQREAFTLKAFEENGGLRETQTVTGDACPECRGLGMLVLPGGEGTLCVPCLGRGRKVRPAAAGSATVAD